MDKDKRKQSPVPIPAIGDVFAGRYKVRELISRPGETPVFKALDEQSKHSHVALKILSYENPVLDGIKREFETLHGLSHKGLAVPVSLGKSSEDLWYLATEYIDGQGFLSWAFNSSPDYIQTAALQLLDALEYLNSNSILHGDIKPENVLVVEEKGKFTIKLIDFGLSRVLTEKNNHQDGISGTLKYIAPEVLKGEPPTILSDLYAVGFLLYEAITGRAPFEYKGIAELLEKKLFEDPIPIKNDNQEITPQFAGAIMRLLSPAPMDRFASPEGARQVICSDARVYPSGTKPPTFRKLFGRDKELEEIEIVLEAQGSDKVPSFLLIEGNYGIGKSRLLDEVSARASLKGYLVITLSSTGAHITTLYDRLAATAGETAMGNDDTSSLSEVIALISRIGQQVVIIADDIHLWPDDQAEKMTLLAATPITQGFRPLIAATTLAGSKTATADSSDTESLAPFMKRLKLEPLNRDTSLEAFKYYIKDIPASAANSAVQAASGEPWLIVQILSYLATKGAEEGLPESFTMPDNISGILSSRFQELDEAVRDMARILEFIGTGVDVHTIAEITGFPDESVQNRLDALKISGVARTEFKGNKLVFELVEWAKPMATELFDDDTEQLPQREKIIDALLNMDHPPHKAIASHYYEQGNYERAIEHLLKATEDEPRPEMASGILEKAFEIACKREYGKAHEIGHELVEALMKAANYEKSLAVLDKLDESEDESPSMLLQRANALEKLGKPKEALELVEKALETFQGAEKLDALSLKSQLLMSLGQYEDSSKAAWEGLELATSANDKSTFISLMALDGYYRGDMESALSGFDSALTLLESIDVPYGDMARANSLKAMALQGKGDMEPAVEHHSRALELARQEGNLKSMPTYLMNLATAYHALNQFEKALDLYQEARSVAAAAGSDTELANILANLGNLLLYVGDLSEASNMVSTALELSSRMGSRSMEAYCLLVKGDIEKEQGNLLAAMTDFEKASGYFEELGATAQAAQAMLKVSTCALELKEIDKAHKFTSLTMQKAVELGLMEIEGRCRMNQALIALDRSRLDEAKNQADKAIEMAEKVNKASFKWEALWASGKVQFASGKFSEAKEDFDKAVKTVDEMKQTMPPVLQDRFLKGARWENLKESLNLVKAAMSSSTQDEKLKKLLEINKRLTSEQDSKKLLEFIMDSVVNIVNAERGFMVLMEGDKPNIAVARNIDRESISKPLFKISRSVAEKVAQTGEPMLTIDAREDPRFDESVSVQDLKLRSIICVPLKGRDKVIGTLYVDNRFQSSAFRNEDLKLMEAFADQAAIAIENTKLMEENIRKNQELEVSRARIEAMAKSLEKKVETQQQEIESIKEDLEQSREKLLFKYNYDGIVGASESIKEILKLLDRITDSAVPVLIEGESGTGKELVAKAIHYNGPRRSKRFVSENVSAIPETLLESELFGHERGAFTGAHELKRGLFEIAHEGTLFLDEIGDMSLGMQVNLLRALQEGEIRRVGGKNIINVDVRVISATNQDLKELIDNNRFREDLYYRLNVVKIFIPPLRERRDDIPLLAAHFIRQDTGGREDIKFDSNAMALLINYDWPGNVRELSNEISRALLIGGKIIRPEHLSEKLRKKTHDTGKVAIGKSIKSLNLRQVLEIEEERAIKDALEEAKGNRVLAAKILGIGRRTLYMKMEKYGI